MHALFRGNVMSSCGCRMFHIVRTLTHTYNFTRLMCHHAKKNSFVTEEASRLVSPWEILRKPVLRVSLSLKRKTRGLYRLSEFFSFITSNSKILLLLHLLHYFLFVLLTFRIKQTIIIEAQLSLLFSPLTAYLFQTFTKLKTSLLEGYWWRHDLMSIWKIGLSLSRACIGKFDNFYSRFSHVLDYYFRFSLADLA